jgi:hypothetical protein
MIAAIPHSKRQLHATENEYASHSKAGKEAAYCDQGVKEA